VRDRRGLRTGQVLAGPMIVESADTTIVVPPGAAARVDEAGSLLIDVGDTAQVTQPRDDEARNA